MNQKNITNTRCEIILNLVIKNYLKCGSPISSKAISSLDEISASSATIRNEMVALEKQGLIFSPHTSAGRIPSREGLRHYVDHLLANIQCKPNMLQKLSSSLGYSSNPEIICAKASKLLADMTRLTGLVVMPQSNDVVIRQLELVRLADRRLLCVLIDEHDQVQNRVVELAQPVSEPVLQQTVQLLNIALAGFTMAEGAERLPYLIKQMDVAVFELVKQTLFGDTLVANELLVYSSGETRLLNNEISNDTDTLRKLLKSFEDVSALNGIFTQSKNNNGVSVFIGEEIGVELFPIAVLLLSRYSKIIGLLVIFQWSVQ
ncbi:heat-inducible transcriptional repressor HrcA [Psychrosphaera aquimarina]|uniref:Heat-inducible transcription repressor HrcA n=1 Tax=Psychrosphaera aquimarina TaxID=2044854 RepID=A0ABU3R3B1_9GAMM|nr:heat-inducible transcriptional repressor HrcA [Psychrosphaera aquimarina]MDU0114182.1 heat-inducible transcriptional repressor HrcA [Psychrosphaera aquimarina]